MARNAGIRGDLPEWLAPQLATLSAHAPDGDDWLHEIKYDGYRLLAWVDGPQVRLLTRNRNDWTSRFPSVVAGLQALSLRGAVVDGEVAVELDDGRTSFQALQNALRSESDGRLRFRVFDALFLDGEDIRALPLLERKTRLEAILGAGSGPVRYGAHVAGHGAAFHAEACSHGLEGIVSKRSGAPYRSGRGTDWLKVKCLREQEFVIGGYTAPAGSRKGLGALHVGTYDDDGRLVYRGKVGSGFSDATLHALARLLAGHRRRDSPFTDGPRGTAARGSTWVEPRLVAQVRYTEMTGDGRLRHPVYHGLREDKPPGEVRFETPVAVGATGTPVAVATPGAGDESVASGGPAGGRSGGRSSGGAGGRAGGGSRPKGAIEVAGARLTSPDRVLYPEIGVTKLDLARYYEAVADWMLPHVRDRPLTLVRCPSGHQGECFFQKHFNRRTMPEPLSLVEIVERDGPALYGTLDSTAGLVSVVQLGGLELHSWNSRRDLLDRPDRFIIDIDPDAEVAWGAVVDAALHVREVLEELGLVTFLRTTGGKGLHVVVPITRRTGWDEVKSFSGAVASLLARTAPTLYTTEMAKRKRKGRILLDYLRNARGATAIEAYSTRARAGAPVAAPIHWDELLDGVRADTFHVGNLPARMTELGADPWAGLAGVRQSITKRMRQRVGLE